MQVFGGKAEGIRLMRALCSLERVVSNVNLPNRGQIEGLPLGAVVETNAVFSKGSIQPVFAGRLPKGLQRLVADNLHSYFFVLCAARDGCLEDVVRAYLPEGWYYR